MIKEEKKQNRSEIIAMWQRNFHDPAPYTEFYFDEVYSENEVLINEGEEGVLRGMLHLNPYQLRAGGKDITVHYIVGVATDEDYRRQGVMRELLIHTFEKLKSRGEFLTYLMPADEAYYLPFDFRFGSDWIELEMEYQPLTADGSGERHEVLSGQDLAENNKKDKRKSQTYLIMEKLHDADQAANLENAARDSRYYFHTEISAEYLKRLDKESRSDFAKLFYVYDGDDYIGRFVAGAQHDFMMLSQISCCIEDQALFLNQVLHFCENRYHYGKYQIILDEGWISVKDLLKEMPQSRLFSLKKKPMIMFRMLDLEKAADHIKVKTSGICRLQVEDHYLSSMKGSYLFDFSPQGCRIERISEDISEYDTALEKALESHSHVPDGGTISIGDLTNILFGKFSSKDIDKLPDLSDDGKKLMKSIIPWQKNCIMEYV